MPVTDPPIELRHVVKEFARKPVLDGVDMTVPAGAVVGLLGKNGAGKTTLIKCAMGLVRVTAGQVRVLGEDAWDLSEDAKGRLGYVPQVVKLYGWMRVAQIIDYVGAFYPRWNPPLAAEMLRRFELDPAAKVGRLSVGQAQKLGILLGMAHEPELLVLDEPAAALDPAARRDFLRSILELAVEGTRTVVLSTHITSDLERVADRVVVLKAGRVAFDGELGALKDSVKRLHVTGRAALPADFAVAGMLGRRVVGNEALLGVMGDVEQTAARIRAQYGAAVEARDLDLEEIFLEIHEGPAADDAPAAAAATGGAR